MKTENYKKLFQSLCIAGTIITLIVLAGTYFKVHFNYSNSVSGFLWCGKEFKPPGERNQYVFICPNKNFVEQYNLRWHIQDRGHCGGTLPLLKRIVGLPGDKVIINARGIFINDKFIKKSRPYLIDGYGKPLPKQQLNGIIPEGKLIIAGDTKNSFDSRYFGLVEEKWIEATAKNIF